MSETGGNSASVWILRLVPDMSLYIIYIWVSFRS